MVHLDLGSEVGCEMGGFFVDFRNGPGLRVLLEAVLRDWGHSALELQRK